MRKTISQLLVLGLIWLLFGCLGGSGSSGDSVLVEGDFAVAYVQRKLDAIGNPTDGARYVAGGDLLMKDLASPSAGTINITASIVQGPHDVSDPEVSYDGTKLLLSMRAPEWLGNTTWNLFEYDLQGGTLSRVIAGDQLANEGDDVDPAYLPDGRIIFSSNRQEATLQRMGDSGKVEAYKYRDEYEREASMVLHLLDPSFEGDADRYITQISFNQSHDRNPTVLMSGQIMLARWDHVGNRNHFPLFTTDPSGTNMFVQYGAFSPGNSFLHPREMPDGRVMSTLMPLSRTDEGGALMVIDVKKFTDNDQPADDSVSGSGQIQARPNFQVPLGREYSDNGRYTTSYPLWDGSNRALVAFKANPREENAETQLNPITGQEEAMENPPRYGIYMLNLDTEQLLPIALPDPQGDHAYTDPIAIIPRDENCPMKLPGGCMPTAKLDGVLNPALADQTLGILNVKSVYDTDQLGVMGARVLTASEDIPMTAGVPDLQKMKSPGTSEYAQRIARFVRVMLAVPTPPGISRELIGESDFEMQQILGYAPIEPDGSLRIQVPANAAIGVSVVDAKGRALQTHTNWIQVRPGETRTCNGCHSPRRGSAINDPNVVGTHPDGQSGETMAETRTRLLAEAGQLDAPAMELSQDMYSEDYWNPSPGVPLQINYPVGFEPDIDNNGVITLNYPDHIQPLWDAFCISCHQGPSASGELDLSNTVGGFGRLISYQELVLGDPIIDAETGLPLVNISDDGEVMMQREAPLVSVGNSSQSSRTSHLVEVLFNEELRATQVLGSKGQTHNAMLSISELRLINEWIDLGAQYYNDPFEDANSDDFKALSETRGGLQGLSETLFSANVHPVLKSRCASCHQAFGNTGPIPDLNDPNSEFSGNNNFVLTGNPEGDFNVTVGMVSDVCNEQNSNLLLRPISDGISPSLAHPQVANSSGGTKGPVMKADGSDSGYNVILNWIATAATENGC